MFLTCFIMKYEWIQMLHNNLKIFWCIVTCFLYFENYIHSLPPYILFPRWHFFNWSFVFQTDSKIEDLMNMLECPVCLDTADRPPIYQCPEGHLLCENCNQRLSTCPQCGHSLLNSRNRTAEGLAVKLQVSFCFT